MKMSGIARVAITIGDALGAAAALGYPDKPVQYIIPFAPAGESDLAARLAGKQDSSVELTPEAQRRAEAAQPALNPLITLTPEQALEAAAVADKRRAAGEGGVHTGVPMVH